MSMIAKRVEPMKQLGLGLKPSTKKTRRREFLEEMERVVPWAALVQIVELHYPRAKTGRPPFGIETMLRIHYLQQWFGLGDPPMEEALHDVALYRGFAKLDGVMARLPDETTILRFRHLLERHDLATDMLRVVNDIVQAKGLLMRIGTVVGGTLALLPYRWARLTCRDEGLTGRCRAAKANRLVDRYAAQPVVGDKAL
jgi:IS5 family transposase